MFPRRVWPTINELHRLILAPPRYYISAPAAHRELDSGIIMAMMTKRLPSKHSTHEDFCSLLQSQ